MENWLEGFRRAVFARAFTVVTSLLIAATASASWEYIQRMMSLCSSFYLPLLCLQVPIFWKLEYVLVILV